MSRAAVLLFLRRWILFALGAAVGIVSTILVYEQQWGWVVALWLGAMVTSAVVGVDAYRRTRVPPLA